MQSKKYNRAIQKKDEFILKTKFDFCSPGASTTDPESTAPYLSTNMHTTFFGPAAERRPG